MLMKKVIVLFEVTIKDGTNAPETSNEYFNI